MTADLLAHIEEGQLDETVFSRVCFTWGVGPLSVELCCDLSVPSVSAIAKLLGVTVGTCSIDTQHQHCKLSGSVSGFKAEVTIDVDLHERVISLAAVLCAPTASCKTYNHQIHF